MAETIRDIKNERNKIWEFQNPEELAKALEEKSKQDLAKRVREISGQVQGNSVDLRKKLQDELSEVEQSQIRKTLPDKWVDNIFIKGMTTEERQQLMAKKAMVWVVWAEATQWLWKMESWMKSIGDSFDVAGELFEKWQFMAAFWVILKGLFWQFSLEEWNKKDDEKKDGKKEEKTDNKNENFKNAEYILWVKALYLMSGKKIVKDSDNVLLTNEFRVMNFTQLEQEYKNKNDIAKRLKLKSHSDEQVMSGIEILISSEKSINNLLQNSPPNWKNLPLENIIDLINQKWWKTLSNMKDKVTNIDVSITNPVEIIDKAMGSMHDLIDIKEDWNWWINFWELDSRKWIISDVSPSTLFNIIAIWKDSIIKTTDTKGNSIETITSKGTDKDKEFIWNLFSYKDQIISWITNIFPNESKEKINSFFWDKWFTLKELFEIYLITWWKTDINNLDWISQSLFYTKLWKILWKDPEVRAIYNVHILNALWDKAENIKLSSETKNFLSNISRYILDKSMDTAKKWLKEIYSTILELPWEKQLAIWALLTAFIAGVWYSRWLLVRLSFWLSTVALAASIFAIAKSEFESKWISEKKIESALNEYTNK